MRVCQFRHDGNSCSESRRQAAAECTSETSILQGDRSLSNLGPSDVYFARVAVIVIFAFNTFDTGHPALAFSAAF